MSKELEIVGATETGVLLSYGDSTSRIEISADNADYLAYRLDRFASIARRSCLECFGMGVASGTELVETVLKEGDLAVLRGAAEVGDKGYRLAYASHECTACGGTGEGPAFGTPEFEALVNAELDTEE